MSQIIAHFPAASSSGSHAHSRPHFLRPRHAFLAIFAALTIVGSALAAPSSGVAAVNPEAEIAASMQNGTLTADITSGAITITQLVNAATAAWHSGSIPSGTQPTRESLTRDITGEVHTLQGHHKLSSPMTLPKIDIDVTAQGHLTARPDVLEASESWKSFWHHFSHWSDIYLSPAALKIIVGTGGAVGAAFFCATPGVSALACGLYAAVLSLLVGIFQSQVPCGSRGFVVAVPDLNNSHCA